MSRSFGTGVALRDDHSPLGLQPFLTPNLSGHAGEEVRFGKKSGRVVCRGKWIATPTPDDGNLIYIDSTTKGGGGVDSRFSSISIPYQYSLDSVMSASGQVVVES